ncbi:hypothetical protein CLF_107568 [Clonorchis sinensis]|uniref:Uncharacterized protein n=1 Tax=Clonorchis sinensis TaxID=79923 RepID=G7YQT6_CLOSI|nr:hypothetical protein CLF_107568 [Clonorchis sinensis]
MNLSDFTKEGSYERLRGHSFIMAIMRAVKRKRRKRPVRSAHTLTLNACANLLTLERCDWYARLIERRPSSCPGCDDRLTRQSELPSHVVSQTLETCWTTFFGIYIWFIFTPLSFERWNFSECFVYTICRQRVIYTQFEMRSTILTVLSYRTELSMDLSQFMSKEFWILHTNKPAIFSLYGWTYSPQSDRLNSNASLIWWLAYRLDQGGELKARATLSIPTQPVHAKKPIVRCGILRRYVVILFIVNRFMLLRPPVFGVQNIDSVANGELHWKGHTNHKLPWITQIQAILTLRLFPENIGRYIHLTCSHVIEHDALTAISLELQPYIVYVLESHLIRGQSVHIMRLKWPENQSLNMNTSYKLQIGKNIQLGFDSAVTLNDIPYLDFKSEFEYEQTRGRFELSHVSRRRLKEDSELLAHFQLGTELHSSLTFSPFTVTYVGSGHILVLIPQLYVDTGLELSTSLGLINGQVHVKFVALQKHQGTQEKYGIEFVTFFENTLTRMSVASTLLLHLDPKTHRISDHKPTGWNFRYNSSKRSRIFTVELIHTNLGSLTFTEKNRLLPHSGYNMDGSIMFALNPSTSFGRFTGWYANYNYDVEFSAKRYAAGLNGEFTPRSGIGPGTPLRLHFSFTPENNFESGTIESVINSQHLGYWTGYEMVTLMSNYMLENQQAKRSNKTLSLRSILGYRLFEGRGTRAFEGSAFLLISPTGNMLEGWLKFGRPGTIAGNQVFGGYAFLKNRIDVWVFVYLNEREELNSRLVLVQEDSWMKVNGSARINIPRLELTAELRETVTNRNQTTLEENTNIDIKLPNAVRYYANKSLWVKPNDACGISLPQLRLEWESNVRWLRKGAVEYQRTKTASSRYSDVTVDWDNYTSLNLSHFGTLTSNHYFAHAKMGAKDITARCKTQNVQNKSSLVLMEVNVPFKMISFRLQTNGSHTINKQSNSHLVQIDAPHLLLHNLVIQHDFQRIINNKNLVNLRATELIAFGGTLKAIPLLTSHPVPNNFENISPLSLVGIERTHPLQGVFKYVADNAGMPNLIEADQQIQVDLGNYNSTVLCRIGLHSFKVIGELSVDVSSIVDSEPTTYRLLLDSQIDETRYESVFHIQDNHGKYGFQFNLSSVYSEEKLHVVMQSALTHKELALNGTKLTAELLIAPEWFLVLLQDEESQATNKVWLKLETNLLHSDRVVCANIPTRIVLQVFETLLNVSMFASDGIGLVEFRNSDENELRGIVSLKDDKLRTVDEDSLLKELAISVHSTFVEIPPLHLLLGIERKFQMQTDTLNLFRVLMETGYDVTHSHFRLMMEKSTSDAVLMTLNNSYFLPMVIQLHLSDSLYECQVSKPEQGTGLFSESLNTSIRCASRENASYDCAAALVYGPKSVHIYTAAEPRFQSYQLISTFTETWRFGTTLTARRAFFEWSLLTPLRDIVITRKVLNSQDTNQTTLWNIRSIPQESSLGNGHRFMNASMQLLYAEERSAPHTDSWLYGIELNSELLKKAYRSIMDILQSFIFKVRSQCHRFIDKKMGCSSTRIPRLVQKKFTKDINQQMPRVQFTMETDLERAVRKVGTIGLFFNCSQTADNFTVWLKSTSDNGNINWDHLLLELFRLTENTFRSKLHLNVGNKKMLITGKSLMEAQRLKSDGYDCPTATDAELSDRPRRMFMNNLTRLICRLVPKNWCGIVRSPTECFSGKQHNESRMNAKITINVTTQNTRNWNVSIDSWKLVEFTDGKGTHILHQFELNSHGMLMHDRLYLHDGLVTINQTTRLSISPADLMVQAFSRKGDVSEGFLHDNDGQHSGMTMMGQTTLAPVNQTFNAAQLDAHFQSVRLRNTILKNKVLFHYSLGVIHSVACASSGKIVVVWLVGKSQGTEHLLEMRHNSSTVFNQRDAVFRVYVDPDNMLYIRLHWRPIFFKEALTNGTELMHRPTVERLLEAAVQPTIGFITEAFDDVYDYFLSKAIDWHLIEAIRTTLVEDLQTAPNTLKEWLAKDTFYLHTLNLPLISRLSLLNVTEFEYNITEALGEVFHACKHARSVMASPTRWLVDRIVPLMIQLVVTRRRGHIRFPSGKCLEVCKRKQPPDCSQEDLAGRQYESLKRTLTALLRETNHTLQKANELRHYLFFLVSTPLEAFGSTRWTIFKWAEEFCNQLYMNSLSPILGILQEFSGFLFENLRVLASVGEYFDYWLRNIRRGAIFTLQELNKLVFGSEPRMTWSRLIYLLINNHTEEAYQTLFHPERHEFKTNFDRGSIQFTTYIPTLLKDLFGPKTTLRSTANQVLLMFVPKEGMKSLMYLYDQYQRSFDVPAKVMSWIPPYEVKNLILLNTFQQLVNVGLGRVWVEYAPRNPNTKCNASSDLGKPFPFENKYITVRIRRLIDICRCRCNKSEEALSYVSSNSLRTLGCPGLSDGIVHLFDATTSSIGRLSDQMTAVKQYLIQCIPPKNSQFYVSGWMIIGPYPIAHLVTFNGLYVPIPRILPATYLLAKDWVTNAMKIVQSVGANTWETRVYFGEISLSVGQDGKVMLLTEETSRPQVLPSSISLANFTLVVRRVADRITVVGRHLHLSDTLFVIQFDIGLQQIQFTLGGYWHGRTFGLLGAHTFDQIDELKGLHGQTAQPTNVTAYRWRYQHPSADEMFPNEFRAIQEILNKIGQASMFIVPIGLLSASEAIAFSLLRNATHPYLISLTKVIMTTIQQRESALIKVIKRPAICSASQPRTKARQYASALDRVQTVEDDVGSNWLPIDCKLTLNALNCKQEHHLGDQSEVTGFGVPVYPWYKACRTFVHHQSLQSNLVGETEGTPQDKMSTSEQSRHEHVCRIVRSFAQLCNQKQVAVRVPAECVICDSSLKADGLSRVTFSETPARRGHVLFVLQMHQCLVERRNEIANLIWALERGNFPHTFVLCHANLKSLRDFTAFFAASQASDDYFVEDMIQARVFRDCCEFIFKRINSKHRTAVFLVSHLVDPKLALSEEIEWNCIGIVPINSSCIQVVPKVVPREIKQLHVFVLSKRFSKERMVDTVTHDLCTASKSSMYGPVQRMLERKGIEFHYLPHTSFQTASGSSGTVFLLQGDETVHELIGSVVSKRSNMGSIMPPRDQCTIIAQKLNGYIWAYRDVTGPLSRRTIAMAMAKILKRPIAIHKKCYCRDNRYGQGILDCITNKTVPAETIFSD